MRMGARGGRASIVVARLPFEYLKKKFLLMGAFFFIEFFTFYPPPPLAKMSVCAHTSACISYKKYSYTCVTFSCVMVK